MIIAPSVLSLDYKDTKTQLEALCQSKATWLHFDVMDGHFVPNLTFGPDILKAFKAAIGLFMDVHIMVENPCRIAPLFLAAGADSITFHVEAMSDLAACRALIAHIQAHGAKAGISLRPATPIEAIIPLLDCVDIVLVMSVNPGFGGQSFIADSLARIQTLKNHISANGYPTQIEVDGGINAETAQLCAAAGADILVAGSFVFKGDIIANVEALCQNK